MRQFKHIDTIQDADADIKVIVKQDREWEEYRVQLIFMFEHRIISTYHTDDLYDALCTAKLMLAQAVAGILK